MKYLILLVAIAALSPVQADWTKEDTQREILYGLALLADAATTADIKNHEDLEEVSPITRRVIGKNPSTEQVVLYFSTIAYGHYLISKSLSPSARKPWQMITFGVNLGVVANNLSLGLRVRF